MTKVFGFCLLCVSCVSITTLESSCAQDKERKPNDSPAFAPVKDDPKLPRVLLIGDSISIGYTVPTQKLLAGKANVHRIPTNAGTTVNGLNGLKNPDNWLGKGKWDVIHFNWGLGDIRLMDGKQQVSIDRYEKNLRDLVKTLQTTNAKLIFATTTPVQTVDMTPPRKNADVEAYNKVAKKIMEENKIAIDDLYSIALPKLAELQLPANVHFNAKGYEALGEVVAASIQTALPKTKP